MLTEDRVNINRSARTGFRAIRSASAIPLSCAFERLNRAKEDRPQASRRVTLFGPGGEIDLLGLCPGVSVILVAAGPHEDVHRVTGAPKCAKGKLYLQREPGVSSG